MLPLSLVRCIVRARRTVALDHGLTAITGMGFQRFLPTRHIALFPQTAHGLVDHGEALLASTCNFLADRDSKGGLFIGYLESTLRACAKYDPLHDEWNQVVDGIANSGNFPGITKLIHVCDTVCGLGE